jgi:hypothetical protein
MFTSVRAIDRIKNLVGWKNHYDLTEVPALNPNLNISESGEYFQDFHPALRLDIIQACLPENRNLDDYLEEKREVGVSQLLGDIVSQRQYEQYAKKTLHKQTVLDKYGWIGDSILSNGRFVGFKVKTRFETGLNTVIKKIGIQVTQPQTLKIYVFHSSKMDAVHTIDITIGTGVQWNWTDSDFSLFAEDQDISGGLWIIGYFQDDLIGSAIGYKQMNWINGPCSSCDGGTMINQWRIMNKYMKIVPFYVPAPNLNGNQMFDLNDTIEVYDNNFGLNLQVMSECDLTDFFIDNRFSLKRGLGLKVAYLILKDIEFSQESNFIEENLKSLIIRDLEGDKDTKYINLVDQLLNEIKGINFDLSKESAFCLPCNNNKGVTYGAI